MVCQTTVLTPLTQTIKQPGFDGETMDTGQAYGDEKRLIHQGCTSMLRRLHSLCWHRHQEEEWRSTHKFDNSQGLALTVLNSSRWRF